MKCMKKYMKKYMKLPALSTIALVALSFQPAHAAQPPLNVVATIGMASDVVREVGGECVEVTTLMGPGTDPHLYRASAGDVAALSAADLIVYGGLHLEGKMVDVLARLGERQPTLAIMEQIDRQHLLADDDEDLEYDPHLWMDVSLWAKTVDIAASALLELRPECAGIIEANRTRYAGELAALHDWAKATLATVPRQQRILVTAHDAFYYFAPAYDFDASEAVQGISTETEASVADIREVADFVTARQVPAIFPETTISPRNIEAVQAAVHDRGWDVAIGGELFSDAMGDEGSPEGTYIGMIRSNVLTIVEALGGEGAPWPEELSGWAERWASAGEE